MTSGPVVAPKQPRCDLEISLHIGAHRTATTTFQQCLERNRQTLIRSGIEVWTPERTRAGLFAGLIERPEDLTAQIIRRGARACGRIGIALDIAANAGRQALLISEENMIGSIRNNLRQTLLYPGVAERLRRFGPAFDGRLRRIGISIRSYDSFWASSLAFGIGQGFRMPLAADLDRHVTQSRRWRDLICDVAAAFPGVEILVWPYERLAGQPERQLALLTGNRPLILPITGLRERSNVSPQCDKLRMIFHLRGQTTLPESLAHQTGRWMPFSSLQRAALRQQYDADLHWLHQGADGLARLIDPAGAVGSDALRQSWADQEVLTDSEDRMPGGQYVPQALAAGEWDVRHQRDRSGRQTADLA